MVKNKCKFYKKNVDTFRKDVLFCDFWLKQTKTSRKAVNVINWNAIILFKLPN